LVILARQTGAGVAELRAASIFKVYGQESHFYKPKIGTLNNIYITDGEKGRWGEEGAQKTK